MDKAEIVFEKIAGPISFSKKVGRKFLGYIKKKSPGTLKPIGSKTTPRQQMMIEYNKNFKTWTGGQRKVSPPDKTKLIKQTAADRYKRDIFK